MYFVYMLRCKDNSIYTGITINLEKRMQEHFSKSERCAKYTAVHNAKKLEAVWKTENRVLASKLEYRIKKLTKMQKENLIKNNENFVKFLDNKILCDKYGREDISTFKLT